MTDRIEQVVRVLAQHRLGRPQGGTARGAFVLCGCGTVIDGGIRDDAYERGRRHIARAMDEAELLATPPDGEVGQERISLPADQVQEQWGYRLPNGRVWGRHSRAEAERTARGLPVVHRFVTDWEQADQ